MDDGEDVLVKKDLTEPVFALELVSFDGEERAAAHPGGITRAYWIDVKRSWSNTRTRVVL